MIYPEFLGEGADRKETVRVLRDYLEATARSGGEDGRVDRALQALIRNEDVRPAIEIIVDMRDHAASMAFNNVEASGLYEPIYASQSREQAEAERKEWEDRIWKPLDVLIGALLDNFPEEMAHFGF